jgi:hypothetical protein
VKTAVSIPDDVFRSAERAAKRLGVSRSELYARALAAYLADEDAKAIRASYDRAFGPQEGEADAAFRREASRRQLLGVEW